MNYRLAVILLLTCTALVLTPIQTTLNHFLGLAAPPVKRRNRGISKDLNCQGPRANVHSGCPYRDELGLEDSNGDQAKLAVSSKASCTAASVQQEWPYSLLVRDGSRP